MKHYYDTVLVKNSVGYTSPAAGATVQVSNTGAGIATIYADDGITTKLNPFTADLNGRFDFFVGNGRYDIQFSGTGFATFTQSNVEITDAMDTTTLGKTPIAFTAANTHSGAETFTGNVSISSLVSGKCIQAGASGLLTTVGFPCLQGNVNGDGMVHGASTWWNDPGFFYFRDEFIEYQGAGIFTDTLNNPHAQISQGWTYFGGSLPIGNEQGRFVGGIPPYIGQFTSGNTATANQYQGLMFSQPDSTIHATQSWALLENPSWTASWIFKVAGEPLTNAAAGSDSLNSQNKKALYIGLAGSTVSSVIANGFIGPRPNIFIGLRYDTSRMPASMQITSVANASGGNTVYTGTFGNNSWTGQNITIAGCTNAANNGTFSCSANNTTTITVANASGVAETTVSFNAVANAASIPLTSVNTASGGNTVYNFTALPGVGVPANCLQGLSLVITGFTNSANNGTFTVVSNTTTTMTLANASGVAETHAAFATGGTIADAFWTFEAVENRQFGQNANVFAQGQTFVTNVPITASGFHRLDMSCTTAGQIKLTLDGSGTNTVTFTIPTMTIGSNGNASIRATGQTAMVTFTVASSATASNSNFSYPPFGAGSSVTWAGFVAPFASLNGTVTLDSQIDASGSAFAFFPTTNNGGQQSQAAQTATGFPALTPMCVWGNDNAANPQTCYRFYVDLFAIAWNTNTSATTNPVLARYF